MIRTCLWLLSLEMLLVHQVLNPAQAFLLDDLLKPLTPFQLTYSPAHVVRDVTHDVTLKCAYEDSQSQTQLQSVSRIRLLKQSSLGWKLIAELRDNEDEPFSELGVAVVVSAQISRQIPDTFLRVHWPVATRETFGTYRCDVIGFEQGTFKHAAEATTEVRLLEENVTTSDMLDIFGETKNEMQHIEEDSDKLDEKVKHLSRNVTGLSNDVNRQSQDIHELRESVHENLTAFEEKLNTLNSEVDSLEENINAVSSDTHALLNKVGSLETELDSMKQIRSGNVSYKLTENSFNIPPVNLTIGLEEDVEEKVRSNDLNVLLQWPKGEYALIQPRSGCPVDLTFLGGSNSFMRIPTESYSVSSTSTSHFSALPLWTTGSVGSDKFFTLTFCEANGLLNTGDWPDGDYCVLKVSGRDCPSGLYPTFGGIHGVRSSSVEDYRSRVAVGQLCCKHSASVDNPMALPTHSPFVLHSNFGGHCQQVSGMDVSEEIVTISNKKNSSSDAAKLCYYTKF